MLTTVAALSRNRVIGRNGQLPWTLPGDMRHFRETTRDGVIVMGRTTYESIGKPLPHRQNWVLTRQQNWHAEGVRVFHQLEDLLAAAQEHAQVWVIGGQQIYEILLPHCQRQWLTEIEADVEGDTFYPDFDPTEWNLIKDRAGPEGEDFAYRFCLYERR